MRGLALSRLGREQEALAAVDEISKLRLDEYELNYFEHLCKDTYQYSALIPVFEVVSGVWGCGGGDMGVWSHVLRCRRPSRPTAATRSITPISSWRSCASPTTSASSRLALSLSLCVSLSVYLSIYLSIYLYLSVCLSVFLSLSISISISVSVLL
jgi:hypothetical protein